MNDENAEGRYDFREPRQMADDVEQTLSAWGKSFSTFITEGWETRMGIAFKWSLSGASTTRRNRITEAHGDDAVFCAFTFENSEAPMWLVFPRPFVVGSLQEMLGETLDEQPEDRRLTDVETSLLEIALQDAARHVTDSQPCTRPIASEFTGLQRSQEAFSRTSDQEPIAQLRFQLSASFGSDEAVWLLSQQAVLEFMTNVGECRESQSTESARLDKTVREIPCQIVVRLGSAKVPASDLVQLQPGDIIVLDQRVSDPLSADVGDITKFHGWPGTVGRRQAFQVAHMTAPNET